MSPEIRKPPNLTIEDATIIFRNFEGRQTRFNPPGRRGFCVLLKGLDPKAVKELQAAGWNVKWLKPREEEDEPTPYIQVAVNYKGRPPKITIIDSVTKNRTYLNEDQVSLLDWADIQSADMILTPSVYEMGGKSGVKAYLKSLYVVLLEDALDRKHRPIESIIDDGSED